jgi:hypothetical protein
MPCDDQIKTEKTLLEAAKSVDKPCLPDGC